jgi:hypothetical protein
MAEYQHRGHTVTDLKNPFVGLTKYRFPVLEREVCDAREITEVKGVVSRDRL